MVDLLFEGSETFYWYNFFEWKHLEFLFSIIHLSDSWDVLESLFGQDIEVVLYDIYSTWG